MYHISDIKKYLHCEKMYYLSKDTNASFNFYLRTDEPIDELLIKYLDIDKYLLGIKNDKNDKFLSNIENYEWFCHARLENNNLRVNIPFIHKTIEGFDVFFIYYGTIIKDLDLITYRTCIEILEKNTISVRNVYIIHLNDEYVNKGTINPKELFIKTEYFKENRIIDIIKSEYFDYERILLNMVNNENNFHKSKYCKQNEICNFYYECFPEEKTIDDDCILTLVSSKYKNEMFNDGIYKLRDIDINKLEGNNVQYAQIMASKNNGIYYDDVALKKWLNQLKEIPISFIDFEWDRYLIPPYMNMKPMDVLCFEFSLYYMNKTREIEHKTFVGKGDCRIEFIEKLIEYLPEEGPILAYNADGAEKLRLDELGDMFPQFKDQLLKIKNRFVDLAIPFVEGMVYDVRMKGDFTLKKLVDIVSDYSYDNLQINNGMEAVFKWRSIDKNDSIDDKETIDNLIKYCSLDAYGLFLVYRWLNRLVFNE